METYKNTFSWEKIAKPDMTEKYKLYPNEKVSNLFLIITLSCILMLKKIR